LKKKGTRKGMRKKGRRKKGEEKGGRKQAHPRTISVVAHTKDPMKSVHLSQFVDKFVFSSDYSKEYIQLIN
jgi:hypothetical protein